MAINKTFILPTGEEITYWKIATETILYVEKIRWIELLGYKDKVAREAGMEVANRRIIYLPFNDMRPVTYADIKGLPDWEDATDS